MDSLAMRDIREAVAREFKMHPDLLLKRSSRREISRPRQVAMYLCRQLTGKSYPEIASGFKLEHTTVLHGVRKIEDLCVTDAELRETVSALAARITDTFDVVIPDHPRVDADVMIERAVRALEDADVSNLRIASALSQAAARRMAMIDGAE